MTKRSMFGAVGLAVALTFAGACGDDGGDKGSDNAAESTGGDSSGGGDAKGTGTCELTPGNAKFTFDANKVANAVGIDGTLEWDERCEFKWDNDEDFGQVDFEVFENGTSTLDRMKEGQTTTKDLAIGDGAFSYTRDFPADPEVGSEAGTVTGVMGISGNYGFSVKSGTDAQNEAVARYVVEVISAG